MTEEPEKKDKVTNLKHESDDTKKIEDDNKPAEAVKSRVLTREEREGAALRRAQYEIEASERRNIVIMLMIFTVSILLLIFVSITNKGIYKIDDDTLSFINQAVNAVVLLMIPFILGSIGALARVLLSGIKVAKSTTLIISSGMMAIFSWIGIKSGVFIALVAPHLDKQGVQASNFNVQTQSDFYTMALVAILVGMFSSNIYIYINQKIEQATSNK